MAKVGRFVVDPKAGAYCNITLDSGEKIIVNHDKGGTKGGSLTIEKTGWFGALRARYKAQFTFKREAADAAVRRR